MRALAGSLGAGSAKQCTSRYGIETPPPLVTGQVAAPGRCILSPRLGLPADRQVIEDAPDHRRRIDEHDGLHLRDRERGRVDFPGVAAGSSKGPPGGTTAEAMDTTNATRTYFFSPPSSGAEALHLADLVDQQHAATGNLKSLQEGV